MAVAKAQAISAQIWNYQQGCFDRSLMAYQPLVVGKRVCLLEALKAKAEQKRQAAAIHAYRLLEVYGKPIRTRSDAEAFLLWLREERGLSDCTIAGLITSTTASAVEVINIFLLTSSSGRGDQCRAACRAQKTSTRCCQT